jgi:hypothetical protein
MNVGDIIKGTKGNFLVLATHNTNEGEETFLAPLNEEGNCLIHKAKMTHDLKKTIGEFDPKTFKPGDVITGTKGRFRVLCAYEETDTIVLARIDGKGNCEACDIVEGSVSITMLPYEKAAKHVGINVQKEYTFEVTYQGIFPKSENEKKVLSRITVRDAENLNDAYLKALRQSNNNDYHQFKVMNIRLTSETSAR